MSPLDLFPGKKTYIVAIGAILTAVGAYFNNMMPLGDMIEAIFAAVAVVTLRKGIKG